MTEIFDCKRCGVCCRNLIKTTSDGYTLGLALIRGETALFPKDVVSPHIAVGLVEPSKIISHQLSINVCPHIDAENRCLIYERRPTACRAFPYSITASSVTAWPDCALIGEQMEAGRQPAMFSRVQSDASTDLSVYYFDMALRHVPVGGKAWFFDLRDRAWKLTHGSPDIFRRRTSAVSR